MSYVKGPQVQRRRVLFIEGLNCSPANRTGSPQGFYKACTFYKHKTYKNNPKVSPFGIALINKMAIKLGDAGTIARYGLAFQYHIFCFKDWTNTIAN